MKIKFVERKNLTVRAPKKLFYESIWMAAEQTLRNGKAIKIPTKSPHLIRQALTQRALRKRINCSVHCVVDQKRKTATVWLEIRK